MIYKYVNVIILKCCLNKDFVRRTMNYDAHCYIIQTIMHINKILLDSIFNTVSLVFSFFNRTFSTFSKRITTNKISIIWPFGLILRQ